MIKKMGFLIDQKGILSRYQNERNAWEEHLGKTKEFISNAIKSKNRGAVAVLGSGWFLDLPLEELLNHFSKIYLFDVYHPRRIKNKYKKYKNIFFVEKDITGGAIIEAYQGVRSYKKEKVKKDVAEYLIEGFQYDVDFDFVISLNILNQLDILSIDYLLANKIYSNNEIIQLRSIIQQKHIDSLPKGKSVLIADYEEIWFSKTGIENGRKNSLYTKLPEGIEVKRWVWDFDNHFNYYSDRNVKFNVMAFEL